MSHNSFGHLFRMTTFGESHGPAIGCVVDGCPPGIAARPPRTSRPISTSGGPASRASPRNGASPTQVKILSGVFEDERTGGPVTTGTPIALLIENVDQRSKDYAEIRDKFRPGHADYTYQAKYGVRDYRGGGRSSARETAARVAAGAIARKIIPNVDSPRRAGADGAAQDRPHALGLGRRSTAIRSSRPMPRQRQLWENYLDEVRKAGSSCGAIIEVVASGVPAGWGAPVYGKLDQDIAAAMMSINAVKGVEIGAGFAAAALSGEENADEIRMRHGKPEFLSNHAGGILGGISTGQDIVVRFAVKPTSSILSRARR